MNDRTKAYWLRYECHTMLRSVTDTVEFSTFAELEDALEALNADESGEYLLAACGERTLPPDERIAQTPRSWVLFEGRPSCSMDDSESREVLRAYSERLGRIDKLSTSAFQARRRYEFKVAAFVLVAACVGSLLFNWALGL